jgi:hopanoid biosynthesis associated protein HpnK
VIFNADDFGRSSSINQAVMQAHREGILTSASLMVTGQAFEEAVHMARRTPTLGVGLHLTLADGQSAGPEAVADGLAAPDGALDASPVRAGFNYFFRRGLRPGLRREIAAQVERFRSTGLPLDHINGHLNIHLHPVVFDLLMELHPLWKGAGFRLTHDPFRLNARVARGRWAYRVTHAVVFSLLAGRARPRLDALGVPHTGAVFGLLQYPAVDEDYLLALLPRLPEGDSEIYSHPSLDDFRHEHAALVSPRVKALLDRLGFQRLRYSDLTRAG